MSLALRAKKSLGQNFLVDSNFVARIVETLRPAASDVIFEIGPGRGALTERLLDSGSDVVAIELDRNLIEPLRQRFDDNKFTVLEMDALQADFPAIFAKQNLRIEQLGSVKLVANLPYYISTAILQHLAEQRAFFKTIVLMFQREVVDRITAPPGTSERGYLTVLAESAFEIERLFDVPPVAFQPAPKVWSAVVRLTPKAASASEEGLKSLLSAAFAQKRKTISNNLKIAYPNYAALLDSAGIDPKSRAEQLELGDWYRLNDVLRLS